MTETYFQNTSEFIEKFDLESNREYFDLIPLQKRRVAFSVKRRYPDNIRYKPAKKESGDPDNVVTIWITYIHPDESEKPLNPNKIPITARVANFSLYRSKHGDYDFNDEASPTEASLEHSLSTPKPLSLEYNDEFFYDHSRNSFIDETNKMISGVDILNTIYSEHCITVHWLKGLRLRSKLLLQEKGSGILSILVTFFIFLLKKLFGRTIEEDDLIVSTFQGYKKEHFKKLNTDSINVFGYKASKSVIILFCIIIIFGAIYQYNSDDNEGYLSYIEDSNFFSLVHGLFFIWFLDVVIPHGLFIIINGLIKLRTKIAFMKFKGP